MELEKAEMDLVSVPKIKPKLWQIYKFTHKEKLLLFAQRLNLHSFQGEYEFSPEILGGKLAEVVYRDAAGKIKGKLFKSYLHEILLKGNLNYIFCQML